jgi:formate dehydrogenase subunit delta
MDRSNNLVRMANDIGNFFRNQPREDAIAGIRNHIQSFWTRAMREKLVAEAGQKDIGLDELPMEALRRLAG